MAERLSVVSSWLQSLFNHPRLREGFRVLRLPFFGVALALLLRYGRCEWFWVGLAISAAGEVLQLWSFACINTRRCLATEGPYALVRNPMYLARYVLLAGMVLWSGRWWVWLGFTLLYCFYMVNRVRREETLLGMIFGKAYAEYCAQVPRFLPRPRSGALLALGRGISRENFRRQHGLQNALAVVAIYALAHWALGRRS